MIDDVALPARFDTGRDLVQLLTPEGERVEHPDYSFDLDDEQITRPLPRPGPHPPHRHRGHRPAAPGRARHLGVAARPGGRPDRLRPRAAPPGLRLPDLPRARRRLVPRVDPLRLLGLFRGVDQGGWDPRDHGFGLYTIVIGAQTLHATGYAMGMQRDGAVGTGDPDRDAAAIAYFGDGATSQGDVNEAFIWASVVQRAGRVLLPEQPVGDLRADRAADPHPAVPARAGLRLPRRPRRRQRRARLPRRDHARRCSGPATAAGRRSIEAYTYRMGAHTTSDDPTRYRSATSSSTGSSRTRSTGQGLPRPRRRADEAFFAEVEAEADELAAQRCARAAWRCPTRTPLDDLRPRLRRDSTRCSRSRRSSPPTSPASRTPSAEPEGAPA